MTAHNIRHLRETETDDIPSIDRIIQVRVEQEVEAVREYVDQRIQEELTKLFEDPLWMVRGQDQLLTAGEAARLLNVSVKTLREYCNLPPDHPKHLRSFRHSDHGEIRVVPAHLAEYIERHL